MLRTARTFDAKTGRIGTIRSTVGMTSERQEFGYTWDVLGNLTTRTDTTGATGADGTRNLTETFTYDNLNRLTSSRVGTGTTQTVTYDALGNIKTKTGVGSYLYGLGKAGPHAVAFAGNATFTYDVAGNLTRENRAGTTTRRLEYTPFSKVSRIVKGNHTTTFAYGPERARYKRTDASGNKTTTTLYMGSVEKVTHSGSLYEYKRYIAGGVALITEKHATTVKDGVSTEMESATTQYLLKDHLGSVAVITDALGGVDQELSYDAWGQRRNAATWGDLTAMARMSFDSSRTTRGFTGHEMVDAVGIIHMNGRIYDPNLGRFMQADPVIQFPDFSQSHNRYSYVLNNPLAYTDPTGYIIPVFTALAVGIAVGFKLKLVATAVIIGLGVFADSLAQGVPLDKAFLAGVSAAALTAAGLKTFPTGKFGLNLATAGHVATVATVGGITTSLQGGKFGHGFLSAGLGSAAPALPGLRQLAATGLGGRALVSAVTAGTVSEITGGKFANGAVSAAFLSLVSSAAEAGIGGSSGNKTLVRDADGNLVRSSEVKGPFVEGDARISSRYGATRTINGSTDLHAGVDLVPINADGTVNTNAYAISGTEGTLVVSDNIDSFGNFVLVKTKGGDYVYYAHLDSRVPNIPTNIDVGTRLGIIGNTGRSTGLHLHVEIRQGSWRTSAPRLSPGEIYE